MFLHGFLILTPTVVRKSNQRIPDAWYLLLRVYSGLASGRECLSFISMLYVYTRREMQEPETFIAVLIIVDMTKAACFLT